LTPRAGLGANQNWLCFYLGEVADGAGFAVLSCYQRTSTKFPILTLALFFQKGSICRDRSTSVKTPVATGATAKYGMLMFCFNF